MPVYSVDKLIAQARVLAADYKRTTGKTLPGIGIEIALHDAAKCLGLKLCSDKNLGYDAIGQGSRSGKRIQIKGRTIFDESKSGQRIGQIKLDKEWDSIVLVLMDENYEPYEIHEAQHDMIMDYIDQSTKARKKRGALSVARFRMIGELVWTREDGLEDEYGES